VPALVALDVPPGPRFVDLLRSVWDAGDAVAPLDRRLSGAAARRLLDTLRPGAVMGADGERRRLSGGTAVEPGDALVVATSGSTGAPRAAVLTHGAVAASARATSRRLGVDAARDRWLACLPLSHIGGLSVVTRALLTGTPLEVHEGFRTEAVEEAARSGATLVSLVATALARIDPARFRTVVLGGAGPPAGLADNVVTTYGMTETGSGIVYDGVPLDGVEVAIGDGRAGAEGEILVRSPTLLRAYRDDVDPRLRGGWFPTGDGGARDGQGRLTVSGRLAEVIVTGGEKVWPGDVERVVARHPAVAEVAVVGRPDPEWGASVVAHVVAAHDGAAPSLAELRALVRDELVPWAAPRHLVVHRALPRTPSGKVARARLERPVDEGGGGEVCGPGDR
jgi:O-succinylbenzoic acid--CoA ligase